MVLYVIVSATAPQQDFCKTSAGLKQVPFLDQMFQFQLRQGGVSTVLTISAPSQLMSSFQFICLFLPPFSLLAGGVYQVSGSYRVQQCQGDIKGEFEEEEGPSDQPPRLYSGPRLMETHLERSGALLF